MVRKAALVFFIGCIIAGFIPAQDNRGDGFVVSLDMGVDAFNFTNYTFGSADIRGPLDQNRSLTHYLISNWNFARDAQAGLEYNASNFGGKFAFQPQAGIGGITYGAKLNGWAQFGFVRVTLGNDIETAYANRQGSDDPILILTQSGWEDPDNITNSEGLMVEAFANPLHIALAAGNFATSWEATSRVHNNNDDNMYIDRFSYSLQFGARIGYELGDIGKINASYKIYYNSVATSFDVEGAWSSVLQPRFADAEQFRHVFGLYGSFNLLDGDLGITGAFLGNANVLVKEYYLRGVNTMVETGVPVVFRVGPAINARWATPFGLTLRTDNALTFWQDKNFDIFRMAATDSQNFNNLPKEQADEYRLISNMALRNGIGLGYFITESIEARLYLQNILRRHEVIGYTPNDISHTYTLIDNTVRAELSLFYHFNANALVYIKLDVSDAITSRSKDLAMETRNLFLDQTVHGQLPVPVATVDHVFVIRVPIGLTLRIR